MFHNYIAKTTVFGGDLFIAGIPAMLILFVAAVAMFLGTGLSARIKGMTQNKSAILIVTFLLAAATAVVMSGTAISVKVQAAETLESEVARKMFAGRCVTLLEKGTRYRITRLDSTDKVVFLTPMATGGCGVSVLPIIPRRILDLELVDKMQHQVIDSMRAYDLVLSAGLQ